MGLVEGLNNGSDSIFIEGVLGIVTIENADSHLFTVFFC